MRIIVDLFFASIEISGSILAPWACGEEVVDDTKHLATALMCPTTGTEGLKNCLRTKTPDQIFEAITKTVNRILIDSFKLIVLKIFDCDPLKEMLATVVRKSLGHFTLWF